MPAKALSLCWGIPGICSRGRIYFMWSWLLVYFTFSIKSLLAPLLYRFLISFNSISFPPVGSYSTFCTSWRAVNPALTLSCSSPREREGSDLGAGRAAVTRAEELICWKLEHGLSWALHSLWCRARAGPSQREHSGISSWRLQEPYVSFYVFSFHVSIINSSGEARVLVRTAKAGNGLGSIFKSLGLLNVRAWAGLLFVLPSHTIGLSYVCSLRAQARPRIQIKLLWEPNTEISEANICVSPKHLCCLLAQPGEALAAQLSSVPYAKNWKWNRVIIQRV